MKRKPIYFISILLMFSLLLGFMQTNPAEARDIIILDGDTTMGFSPTTAAATTCGTIDVNVVVNDVVALTGYHLEMTFDQTKLEVVNVVNGGLLYDASDRAGLYEPILDKGNTTGRLIWGMAQRGVNGDPTPVTGSGNLVKITLKALATSGSVALTIDDLKTVLVDWPDAFDIDYTVSGPATISLASCAPTDISLSNATVAENLAAPALVGTLSATDPDSADTTFTYSLVDAVNYPDNAAFGIASSNLNTAAAFNYEVKSSYQIKIRATDPHGAYFDKVFTITVTDVNDAPVLAAIGPKTVANTGTLSFTPTASDEDLPAQTFTWSLGAGAPAGATIDAATGAFSWAPGTTTIPGSYTATICVSDGIIAAPVCQTVSITVTDGVAPVLTSVTPPEGIVYLAGGENFVLTVDALDDNLYSLEIDHSFGDYSLDPTDLLYLPEFTVYASEGNVYGSPEAAAAFASYGVSAVYNATTQTWTIDFGANITNTNFIPEGVTFYLVLHDQAGNKWGSMSPTTPENTFAYTLVRDDVAPVMQAVTPPEGDVYLADGENFVLTIDALDTNLYSLEIDHSMAASLPEFTVYASESDPYGGQATAFATAGVSVTYDTTAQKWTINFGNSLTNAFIANPNGITFYMVLEDMAGNTWGSMYTVTPENTFAYKLIRDDVAPLLVSVTPPHNSTVLLGIGDTFKLTIKASDDNLYSLEIDHSMQGSQPEFTVYASEGDPYGGDIADFTAAGVTVTYDDATQTWVIDFGPTVSGAIATNGGITFYMVLEDLAGNTWGSMYTVTPENTFKYIVNQDLTQPIISDIVAKGASGYSDVTAVGTTLTVAEGYQVATIEITMSEPVAVAVGTQVTINPQGVVYGTVTAVNGAVITVTPAVGNETASVVGTFTFTVPAGAVEDLAGNAWLNVPITLVVQDATAPTIVSGVAHGVAPYADVTADSSLSFAVPQGYEVSTIAFTMSEPVTITAPGIVYLGTVPYGTMTAAGSVVTVTPDDGNEIASLLGTFTFNTDAGSIKDLAGNPLSTLSATLIVTDQTAPVMQAVLPAEGQVTLGLDDTFVLTIDAFDLNLYSLEIDHSFEGTLPEFTVYASESNPWGSPEAEAAFDSYGMSISYDATAQKWTIDFGEAVTDTYFIPNGVTFYMVLRDEAGNQWGTMYGTTPENTFVYTFAVTNTLDEEIASASEYEYDPPYVPVGDYDFDINSNTYTGTYTAPQVLARDPMNDMARYLGALYRQDGSTIISIVYGEKTYTWDTTGTLVGSNWEDSTGKTLVSQVTADFQAAILGGTWNPDAGFVMTVGDGWHTANVTFKMIILNTLDPEIASAKGYVYTPVYTYVGSYAFVDATNIYTVTYNDTNFAPGAMYDLARYLGALHRQAEATVYSITYKGTIYTWDAAGTLLGSNWEDASGTTLISVITADALGGQIDPALGFTLTLSDVFHTETVTFRFVINDTTAPTIVSGVAHGVAPYTDVTAVGTTLTVTEGYQVATIEITMSEPVAVAVGTQVTINPQGVVYGTVTAVNGAVITVTPAVGNETASVVGTFTFTVPAGAVEDLAGNAWLNVPITLVVQDTTAPTIGSGKAIGASGFGDVTADANLAFVVNQGYTVDHIEFVMSEEVTVVPGTMVSLGGKNYGAVTVSGTTLIVTPTATSKVASVIGGPFTFTIPAGSIKDLAGNPLTTLSATLTVLNVAPVAVDDAYTTDEDEVLTVAAPGVLSNDTDFDVTILTAILVDSPASGTLVLNADGSFTYTPDANFNGTASFTYKANDGLADSNVAIVTITVTAVNDAPVAEDQSVTTDEDTAIGITLVATDVEGDPLTYAIVAQPAHGSVSLVGNVATYTPALNYTGSDSFTFKSNDGTVDSNVATVTITVTAVNDAPVAVNDAYSTTFDTLLTVVTPGVLDNDSDVDLDPMTAVLVTNVSNGTLALASDGSFTYTPNTGFSGVDTFSYKANDGVLDSNIATVSITVSAFANTPPVAVADTYETDENVVLVIAAPGVLSNDYDIDDDNLTATLKTNVTNGTLVLLEDGSFTYKPKADFCGTDSFVYTLVSYPAITSDGWTAEATATITVYCDAIISSSDLDGPFYVSNLQEFHVRLQNPAPGHVYGSLAASIFVDNITLADFSAVAVKHPVTGTWVPLTPVVDGTGLRIDLGPISSIPITSGFDQTLTFRVNFNTAGSYPVTGTLYDGAIDPLKAIATYSDTMIVAGLVAQDFGYTSSSNVMGVSAGFGNVNFDLSQATEIKVELFTGTAPDYILLQTNTAIDPDVMATWTQFSGPFDIFGTFDYAADGYWNNVRAAEYGQTAIPTRVLATITLPGGITLTAENTILTGDRGYILDTLDEEIASASEYEYDPPYVPVGDYDFDIDSNTYTGTYTAPQVLAGDPMNDMARYLGALYRQTSSTITSIVYDGKTYTWDTTGTLFGSNWEDSTGKTLVSQVTADFQAAILGGTWDPDAGFVMTVHDDYDHSATVTFKMIILNTLDPEIASAKGYVYTPVYTYVGSYAFVDATNIYTVTYNDTNFAPGAMYDLARYLGALHRQAEATVYSITYKGTIYTWDAAGTLLGSNWEDASGTTLISVITADALGGQIDPALGFTLTLSDVFHTETVTFRFVINDTTAPTIGSGKAIGASGFGDVTADANLAFIVNQGYTVDHIEFVMSEAVTVEPGTMVSLGGKNYGAVTVSGTTLIVTPTATSKVASVIGGPFTFTIPAGSIKDLAGNPLTTLSATLTVLNVAPVAVADTYTTDEGVALVVAAPGVLSNDTDFDPSILTAIKVSEPAHGTLVLNADGSFTYTPVAGFHGMDTFTYKANDGLADSNVATVTITVTAVNDAPVAEDQSVTTDEDTAIGITLVATDVDGDPLTYAVVAGPTHGTLSGTAPDLTYTPALNYTGSDSFTFKANDGTVDSNVATVTITVTAVNDAPVAEDQSVTTDEDTAIGITLVATDVDGDPLTYAVVAGPTHGTLSGTAPDLTYTPALNYTGSDSFTFKANDGTVDSNVATVTITVTAVNDAPVAEDQSVTTDEDTAIGITLVATDVDGDPLTYAVVAGPTHGTLSGTAPDLTYTPALNYTGSDSFTFKANDGTVDSNVATVTITVTAVNDAPVAADQSVTTAEDTAKAITLVATDVEGDTLTYTVVAGPTHGTLSGTAPDLTYTPALNYTGSDSFTFKANDGTVDSNVATVTITVTAVNDAPVAADQSVTTAEDTAKAITLVATDVEGDPLTYAIVAQPAHGSVSLVGNVATYTPALNYTGSDSFTFKANDGTVDSNVATVTITVTAVNDAPVAADQSVTTAEDTAKAITLVATDVEGDPLTYAVVAGPTHGTLSGTAPNLTYTPALNYTGSDSFTFKANDGTVDSNVATVTITVTAVNDAPVAEDQSVTTAEDTAKTITLVATDVESDPLTYAIVVQPAHGSVSLVGNIATYTPALNYTGSDSFTFKANDGTVDSNVATVTITVTAVNDAPVAVDDEYTMAEKDTLTITAPGVLGNDSDVDGDSITAILVDTVTNGTLTLNADGSFTYTPDEYFNGTDSFTYKAKDAVLESELAVVTITVTPVNDWPIANDDYYETLTGVDLVKDAVEGILANDVLLDPDEEVSIQILDAPQHGTLSMNNDGSFTYTPDAGFMGTDTFHYLVLSVRGKGEWSDDAMVTIMVKPYMGIYLPLIFR